MKVDTLGRSWALVRWYGWSAEHDSWEPESAIPEAIVSRYKRTYGNTRGLLEFDPEGNIYV